MRRVFLLSYVLHYMVAFCVFLLLLFVFSFFFVSFVPLPSDDVLSCLLPFPFPSVLCPVSPRFFLRMNVSPVWLELVPFSFDHGWICSGPLMIVRLTTTNNAYTYAYHTQNPRRVILLLIVGAM